MNALTRSGLAALHVVAFGVGLILLFSVPEAGVCVFAPLVLAQLGLINTWLAFGEGRWHDRFPVWAAAMCLLLMPLLCFPLPLAALHAAGLLLVRRRIAGLYYFVGDPRVLEDRRLQFSVKQLMLVTLSVSIAFAAARAIKTLDGSGGLPIAQAAAFAVAFVAGLLCSHAFALWAVLGTERPFLGIAAALAVASGLGGTLALAVEGSIPQRLALTALFLVQGAIFAASLFVVRNEGYRLFRHPPPPFQAPAREREIQFLDEPPTPLT
jgi:hypothetical protein